MGDVELEAGITANDYLAWARRRLVDLYEENDKQVKEKLEQGKYPSYLDQRLQILKTLSYNIGTAAKAATEIREARMAAYKRDPGFQRIWATVIDALRMNPAAIEKIRAVMEAEDVEFPG
jgi:hypothetical protein